MSIARRQAWGRLLRRLVIGVALVVGATAVASGCMQDDEVSTQQITLKDLRKMVLPRDELGLLAQGLEVNAGDSGWVTNTMSASDSIDPKDSARTLSRYGRLGGFELDYSDPRGFASDDEERPLAVGTEIELFRDEAAASAYLHRGVDDVLRLRGRRLPGGKIATAERFGSGDFGDETEGIRAAIKIEGEAGYLSAVAFRRGRLVATATAWRRVETKSPTDALQIAEALDERISGVAAGEISKAPVKLPPREWWHAVPDPRPLTLESREVVAGAKRTHRSYLRARDAFVYFREYELVPARRLQESRIVYLRTMTQAFRNARLAERDAANLASGKGRKKFSRGFLRGAFQKSSFRPTGITSAPLTTPDRDTTAFRFSLDVPRGRWAGVLVAVRRGRLVGSVLAMGFDADLRSEDVLDLRAKLRERLASA